MAKPWKENTPKRTATVRAFLRDAFSDYIAARVLFLSELPVAKQTFYFKFRGIKDGNFDRVLVIATKTEKEAIDRRFAEELQRAGLKS